MFRVSAMSEPEENPVCRMFEVDLEFLAVMVDHGPAKIDFQFPRRSRPGPTFSCDDAMLCAITCYLNTSRMFFASSFALVGAAGILFDILEAILADGYRIAIP